MPASKVPSFGCAKCRRAKKGCKFCREPAAVKVVEGEEFYWVDRIADERPAEYLVWWFGYTEPTWEPEETIREDAPVRVKEWEALKKRIRTMQSKA